MTTKRISPAKQLGILAMEFRGAQDQADRKAIARAYAEAVDQLIASKKWRSIPPLEDQLPDRWMPDAFFRHWSLNPPPHQAGRAG